MIFNRHFGGFFIKISIKKLCYGTKMGPEAIKKPSIGKMEGNIIIDIRIRKNGAPGRTRIPSLLIRNQSLYPIELRAHISNNKYNNIYLLKKQGVRK